MCWYMAVIRGSWGFLGVVGAEVLIYDSNKGFLGVIGGSWSKSWYMIVIRGSWGLLGVVVGSVGMWQ